MRKFWTVIGLFASATPVGILLGVVLSNVANSDGAASVSALASGGAALTCSLSTFWVKRPWMPYHNPTLPTRWRQFCSSC